MTKAQAKKKAEEKKAYLLEKINTEEKIDFVRSMVLDNVKTTEIITTAVYQFKVCERMAYHYLKRAHALNRKIAREVQPYSKVTLRLENLLKKACKLGKLNLQHEIIMSMARIEGKLLPDNITQVNNQINVTISYGKPIETDDGRVYDMEQVR